MSAPTKSIDEYLAQLVNPTPGFYVDAGHPRQ